jgi:hypothetical protein
MMPGKVVMSCNEVTLDGSSSIGSRQSCGNILDNFDKAGLEDSIRFSIKAARHPSNCSINQLNLLLSFGYARKPLVNVARPSCD